MRRSLKTSINSQILTIDIDFIYYIDRTTNKAKPSKNITMAYSQKQIDEIFDDILHEIEQGNSLISILRRKEFPSTSTFYQWLEADESKAKRYARACEIRADVIFEDIIDIADHSDEDHTPFTGANVVQRDRLKIDARKWIVAKLHPKKYSEKTMSEITVHQEQPLFPDVSTNDSNK